MNGCCRRMGEEGRWEETRERLDGGITRRHKETFGVTDMFIIFIVVMISKCIAMSMHIKLNILEVAGWLS